MSGSRVSPKAPVNISRLLRQAFRHHQSGHLSRAAKLYATVLARQPTHFDALHLLGVLNYQQGNMAQALAYIGAALRTNSRSAEGLSNHGLVLHELGRYEDAVASYDQALALKPDAPAIHNGRGNALTQLGRHQAALESFDRALAIQPDYLLACYNRGTCRFAIGQSEEALADFDRALAIDPHHIETLGNRGNALFKLNRLEEALRAYEAALALAPHHRQLLHNRAHTLRALGRPAEALVAIAKAIDIAGNDPELLFERSLIELTLGAFGAGWRSYESRWQTREFAAQRRKFSQPLWLGDEPLEGKTILLHAEQGYGDTLQFLRYLRPVARLGARVILEVQSELKGLLSAVAGAQIVIGRGEPQPHFDLHCPLASLPLAFKTELDTIPAAIPYIAAPEDRVALWREPLARSRVSVGLVWAGRPSHENDRNRSIALEQLTPLLTVPSVGFVSLQRELRPADHGILRRHPRIFCPDIRDFADTAAIISSLDLVVSVDTAVAHLAGALGKPVFILLALAADFRWMLEREDSPWYPTARLFRQQRLGDWEGVVAQLRRALEHWPERLNP